MTSDVSVKDTLGNTALRYTALTKSSEMVDLGRRTTAVTRNPLSLTYRLRTDSLKPPAG